MKKYLDLEHGSETNDFFCRPLFVRGLRVCEIVLTSLQIFITYSVSVIIFRPHATLYLHLKCYVSVGISEARKTAVVKLLEMDYQSRLESACIISFFYLIDFGVSMVQNLKCVWSVLCADLFLYQDMPT